MKSTILLVGLPGTRFRRVQTRILEMRRAALAMPAGTAPTTNIAATPENLLAVHHLDIAWRDAVREGAARAVLLLDGVEEAFAEMLAGGTDQVSAIRTLAVCITPAGELVDCAGVLLVTEPAQEEETLGRVAFFCGWPSPLANMTETPPPSPQFTAEQTALLSHVLAPALHYAATGARRRTIWHRACLYSGDRPDNPAPRVIELIGWARVLVYGPYLPLPPGVWRMCAVVALSPRATGAELALELHGTELIGRRRFTVERAGLFSIRMDVSIGSARDALEIRLLLESGAIEGCLGIDHIAFDPVDFGAGAHSVE